MQLRNDSRERVEARFFCVLRAFYVQGYTRYRAGRCKGVVGHCGAFERHMMIYDSMRQA